MQEKRASGIILHPTSLPGPYGIGDLGPAAHTFVDLLRDSGCSVWQVMPLGPTGYGDSPYQCFSAFAGNPLLVSPDLLVEEGLLSPPELEDLPAFEPESVDYSIAIDAKMGLLELAWEHFQEEATDWQQSRFERFLISKTTKGWLTDYTLFRALKDAHDGAEWVKWDPALRDRAPEALAQARETYAPQTRKQAFFQWLFFEQWASLRRYANQNGIQILGDVPIFVAHDSADAWANPAEFYLDPTGRPTVVAGVPPDYFSPTGQLWGNPLYRWEKMQEDDFSWWIERLEGAFQLYDWVRLDHFRGFQAYWEVPGGDETAMNGRWVEAPGEAFFEAVQKALGDKVIIAEDLGLITPEVNALRAAAGFPGMKILQFAFGDDASNEYLPHNVEPQSVIYTGTHDNDTTLGWYEKASDKERDRVRRYLGVDGGDICWDMIRSALASVSQVALFPMQDILQVGSEGRMNTPGKSTGNWSWRFRLEQVTEATVCRLMEWNQLYGRAPEAS